MGTTQDNPGSSDRVAGGDRSAQPSWAKRLGSWQVLVPLLLVANLGYWAWHRGLIFAPPVTLPDKYDQLQPDVRTLVDKFVEQVKESPRDATRHGQLGLVYEANELWPEAKRAFATAVDLAGPDPLLRLHLAVNTHQSGDSNASRVILASVVADAPDLAAAQQRYGQVLMELNELGEAEKAFQKAIDLEPNAAEAYTGLADVRIRQNRFDDALPLLEKSLQLDPKYRVTHFLLGTVYRQKGRLDDAQRELELGKQGEVHYIADEMTKQGADLAVTARARHARGVKLMTERKYQKAVISLLAAHRAAPDDVVIMNALAGAFMQTNRPQDAHKLLLRALQLDDRHGTTYINLASWYAFAKKPDEALRYAEGAVQRSPTVPLAHIVRIDILMRERKYKQARAATDEALAVIPRDPAIQNFDARLKSMGITK